MFLIQIWTRNKRSKAWLGLAFSPVFAAAVFNYAHSISTPFLPLESHLLEGDFPSSFSSARNKMFFVGQEGMRK